MAVRLKFANDLNIFGSSRGAGGFLSTPALIGGGYPAYGTLLSTAYGVNYEVGAGLYSSILASFVWTQTCDVDTEADGVGGSFVDWANARNVQYKPYGTHIADGYAIPMYPVEVPSGSGNYYNSALSDDSEEIHNGTGQSIIISIGFGGYLNNGTVIAYDSAELQEVPSGSGNYVNTGRYNNFVWDGVGGYYSNGYYGSHYIHFTEVDVSLRYTTSNAQLEVPDGSGAYYDTGIYYQDTYYWDGSGGVYTGAVAGNPQGSLYPFGHFITDNDCPVIGVGQAGLGYFWDGYSGYYIGTYP